MLILICGLPGSGKTYFAKHFAKALGATHLNTDQIRNELGKRGQYNAATKSMIYEQLLERAKKLLLQGKLVIVDATFHQVSRRAIFYALAKKLNQPIRIVEIKTSEEIAMARVAQKRSDSEAGPEVFQLIKAQFEAIREPHLSIWSTNDNLEIMLDQASSFIQTNPV